MGSIDLLNISNTEDFIISNEERQADVTITIIQCETRQ